MVFVRSCENRLSRRINTRVKRTIILTLTLGFLTCGIFIISIFRFTPLETLESFAPLPKIQHDFQAGETIQEKVIREKRRESVKNGFLHAWNGYSKYAWGYDELRPVSNQGNNKFNGWGATIVDSLDTLWIMDLKDEFYKSREFVSQINFFKSNSETNVFETIIRYLGGLLSAFELSRDPIFLEKAKELGIALLPAFNSTTGLPYNSMHLNPEKRSLHPWGGGLLSEVGTACLEYTKLAQLTGDQKFFLMVNNITQVISSATKKIPGLYPIKIDQETGEFTSEKVSFGANGDSFYEYLLKEYVLARGALEEYRKMYIESIESMYKYLIKESPVSERPDLLFLGELSDNSAFLGKMGHLSCFVPGMLAIGSKILDRPKDLEIAIKLAETCYWSNRMTRTGIGAEEVWFEVDEKKNTMDQSDLRLRKRLPEGIFKIGPSYSLLRPETIESLFILYRITGDKKYQDQAWDIWQSIEMWSKTPAGYSGLNNVDSEYIIKSDGMESFFLAETLKYLYLIFSPPDLISLDTYVFNTEAHPLLRTAENFDFLFKSENMQLGSRCRQCLWESDV